MNLLRRDHGRDKVGSPSGPISPVHALDGVACTAKSLQGIIAGSLVSFQEPDGTDLM